MPPLNLTPTAISRNIWSVELDFGPRASPDSPADVFTNFYASQGAAEGFIRGMTRGPGAPQQVRLLHKGRVVSTVAMRDRGAAAVPVGAGRVARLFRAEETAQRLGLF